MMNALDAPVSQRKTTLCFMHAYIVMSYTIYLVDNIKHHYNLWYHSDFVLHLIRFISASYSFTASVDSEA